MKFLQSTLFLLSLSLCAFAAPTHIQWTMLLNDGITAARGKIVVSGPNGGPYAPTTQTITIGAAGAIDFTLLGCPGCSYRAQYALTDANGRVTVQFEERWVVPDTATVLTIPMLWAGNAPPYYLISIQQINAQGLSANQVWVWNGTAWVTAALLTNPMTASGEMVYGGSGGTPARLAAGSTGQWLRLVAGVPAWTTIDTSLVGESGSLYFTNARARAALSVSGQLTYDSATGIFGLPSLEPAIAAGTTSQYWRGDKTWRDFATDALAAVTWSALAGKPATFAPSAHAASHQNGGADEVATATPAANAIPKAGGGGTLAAGWIPTLNQSTTGNAATATALATLPSKCSSGQFPLGVDASGNAQNCTSAASGGSVVMSVGAGDPISSCTAPGSTSLSVYFDTTGLALWYCSATNTWRKVLDTSNAGPFILTGLAGGVPATPASGYVSCGMVSADKAFECTNDTGAVTKIGSVSDAGVTFSDVTTGNATASAHGFLPKLSNSATDVLLGTGLFGSAPNSIPDPTVTMMREYFPATDAVATQSNVGSNGWSWRLQTGATTPAYSGSSTTKSGVVIHSSATASGATANTGGNSLFLGNLTSGFLWHPPVSTITGWEDQFTFSVSSLTNIVAKACLADATNYNYMQNSVCVVFDTLSGVSTAHFLYRVCSGGTCATDIDSGVAASVDGPGTPGHYRLRLRSTSTGVVRFSISTNGGAYSSEVTGGTGQTVNRALPTVWLVPVYSISNANNAADVTISAYYFSAFVPTNGQ